MLELGGATVVLEVPTFPTAVLAPPPAGEVLVLPQVGPAGAPGSSGGQTFTQTTPAAEATYSHALGRLPNVGVYVDGVQVETDVAATTSTVTVTFPTPTAFALVLS